MLELLLAVTVICIAAYLMLQMKMKKPSLAARSKSDAAVAGIDTSSYRSIVNSTQEKVSDLNAITEQRERQAEDRM